MKKLQLALREPYEDDILFYIRENKSKGISASSIMRNALRLYIETEKELKKRAK